MYPSLLSYIAFGNVMLLVVVPVFFGVLSVVSAVQFLSISSVEDFVKSNKLKSKFVSFEQPSNTEII